MTQNKGHLRRSKSFKVTNFDATSYVNNSSLRLISHCQRFEMAGYWSNFHGQRGGVPV